MPLNTGLCDIFLILQACASQLCTRFASISAQPEGFNISTFKAPLPYFGDLVTSSGL